MKEFYPPAPHPRSALTNPTTGALQSDAAYKRQLSFLEKAEQNGHTVLRGETDADKRRLGISLVIMKQGVKPGEAIMDPSEEIFGPVLPIIPVDVRPFALDLAPVLTNTYSRLTKLSILSMPDRILWHSTSAPVVEQRSTKVCPSTLSIETGVY